MVTHLTTNPPVSCLNIAEQTGCVVLKILWSYVKELNSGRVYIDTWKPEQGTSILAITTFTIKIEWLKSYVF